jgi:hypothetical protein
MFLISIIKNSVVTNQAQFEDMEKLNEWLSKHESMKTFGQPAYTTEQQIELIPAVYETQSVLVKEAVVAEDGTELEPAQFEEQQVLVAPAVLGTQTAQVAGEYEVVIEDITAKLEQARINEESQKFLNETDWKVLRHRDQLEANIPTSLSPLEYQDLLQARQSARATIIR